MDTNALAAQISALDQGYNPTEVYNRITTELGLPDARTRVQALSNNLLNTENAIRAVDPNVTARTSNALVTEAQRGRLVNMEKAPLTDTYSQQNQAYGKETSNLNELTGQATQRAGLEESAYKTKRQSLADQLRFAQEQAAEQQRRAEADRAFNESVRQFNNPAASSSSGGGRGSSAADASPAMQQRASDKGFNFQSASGGAISARTYAALKGYNFNDIVKQMASAGDKGAADYLKNGSKSKYAKALTWG